jgi:azurin
MFIIDKLKRLEEKWREKERERVKSHSKELKPGESRSLKFPGNKLLKSNDYRSNEERDEG